MQTKESNILESMLTSIIAPSPPGSAALTSIVMFGDASSPVLLICTTSSVKKSPLRAKRHNAEPGNATKTLFFNASANARISSTSVDRRNLLHVKPPMVNMVCAVIA